jgi:hypothetical protein
MFPGISSMRMKPERFFPDHNPDTEQVEATTSMPPDSAVATLVASAAAIPLLHGRSAAPSWRHRDPAQLDP